MTACSGVKYALTIVLFALLSFSTKAQLSADFTASPLAGCAPLVVNFTDQSTGSPVQWKWDLGNGTISFLQNPSATFFNPGSYNIKLVVYNAAGDSSVLVKTQYVSVYAAQQERPQQNNYQQSNYQQSNYQPQQQYQQYQQPQY